MSHKGYFLLFSMGFDRDPGLDQGRLSLNHIDRGVVEVWVATSATQGKQGPESFHERGGVIPPPYRCGIPCYQVPLLPLARPRTPGIAGNFYKITPFAVTTDRGGKRGDFGIHKDANVPGSMGCIVLSPERFAGFEQQAAQLRAQGATQIPLYVQYS